MSMFTFGRNITGIPQEEIIGHWGARAIYTSRSVSHRSGRKMLSFRTVYELDFVPDRVTPYYEKMTKEEKEMLINYMVNGGETKLRQKVQAMALPTSSQEVHGYRDGRFYVEFSPQGSYGYMYIAVALTKE